MKVNINKVNKPFSVKTELEHEYAEREKEREKEKDKMRACKWFIFMFIVLNIPLISALSASSNVNPTGNILNAPNVNSITISIPNQSWLEGDGINDWANYAGEYVNLTEQQSFSFWFKYKGDLSECNGTYNCVLFSHGGFYLQLRNESGTLNLIGRYSDSVAAVLNRYTIGKNNNWNHVVYVYTPNANVLGQYGSALYINGKLAVDSNNLPTSTYGNVLNARKANVTVSTGTAILSVIGNTPTNTSIDDIRVYNHSLSGEEVMKLYYESGRAGAYQRIKEIPVYMFHTYCDGVSNTGICVNNTQLRAFLDHMNRSGYNTITDVDYYNWVTNGASIPEKPFIMTFDDGYKTWVTNLSLIMNEYGYKGVGAVTVANINQANYLNWSDVRTLINNYSWSIASHSWNHCHMGSGTAGTAPTWCNDSTTRINNLSISKQAIILNTNFTPITMIFPWNDWGINSSEQTAVMNDCKSYYSLCFGNAYETTGSQPISKISNFSNGDLTRIAIYNYTNLNGFYLSAENDSQLNRTLLMYHINYQNGTTAYSYGSLKRNLTLNNGVLWKTDGQTKLILDGIDYSKSITNTNVTISWINQNLYYEYFTIDYILTSGLDRESCSNIMQGLGKFGDFVPIIITVIIAGLVVMMLRQDDFDLETGAFMIFITLFIVSIGGIIINALSNSC